MRQYVQGYTVGSNAGILSLQAPTIVLDGTILGIVTNGLQQVLTSDPTNSSGNQSASGYTEAQGGTLLIGGAVGSIPVPRTDGDQVDNFVQSITVSPQTSPVLSAVFQPADLQGHITPLPSTTTLLSAPILTNAGLGTLNLAANTAITVQKGAQITLNPGGTFQASARRIENYGGITVPGGKISLLLQTDVTSNLTILDSSNNLTANSRYVPLNEVIYLGEGSSLVAGGERIDNTGATASSTGVTTSGYVKGGSIAIQDQTVTGQGVFVAPGASLDVSGGWQISTSGKVSGGDAGSVALQGPSLIVNGVLEGQSLVGNKGGSITMTAPNIAITASAGTFPAGFSADSTLPQNLLGHLLLGAHQLDGTGFTSIALKSVNDIAMQGGTIEPSVVKLATPVPGSGTQRVIPGFSSAPTLISAGTVFTTQDQIGENAITLSAGTSGSGSTAGLSNPYGNGLLFPSAPNPSAAISIGSGATIKTAPTGSITMTAPFIDIAGLVSAPAGSIALTSLQGSAMGTLTLEPSARILAEGYNQPGTSALVKGMPAQATPFPGGTVALTAGTDLILSPGSLVSVAGSSPIQQTVIGNDGTLSFITNASTPGAISLRGATIKGLSVLDQDLLQGRQPAILAGQTYMQGQHGGTLSVQAGALSLQTDDLARFRDGGFDSLSLTADGDLSIRGSGQVFFGRDLTLSAARIVGAGTDPIVLGAPWVKLIGSGSPSQAPALAGGQATINLAGTWLDVSGTVAFSGFGGVYLAAARDMTLTATPGDQYVGQLSVPGDLTLQAARIYPTTLSGYTIDAKGKVTVLPSGAAAAGPIYSAAGSLAVASEGAGIDMEGFLAAPLGTISLRATGTGGRVYLADGSVTTTRGSDVPIMYGTIQSAQDSGTLGDNIWAIPDKANLGASVPFTAVQNAPAKSILLTAANGEVIVRDGAVIDVSGGGSVFASRFVPSYSGSNNPLAGAYVIVPGVTLPGQAVYLPGIKGLPAGTYSLLPAASYDATNKNWNPTQWAFMPGAMIVTDLGAAVSKNKATLTADGYPIVAGFSTFMGTTTRSTQPENYEVRPASAVLLQGDFQTQSAVAGAAGSVTITGSTTVLNGTVRASALPGYGGGSIALSGNNVLVQQTVASLPSGFSFATPVPSDLTNTLTIAAPSLSGQGFQTIGLGVSDVSGSTISVAATTVELKPGVTLQAENIVLGAKDSITLDAGAQALALALPNDTGRATFISPAGTLNIGANAVVHASNSVNLQTANTTLDPTATLTADHSSLNLQNSAITLVQDGSQATGAGLFLTVGQWSKLSSVFENITLTSSSDVVFSGSFDLSVRDALTIDAGRVIDSVANASVALSAQTIALQNTTGAPSISSGSSSTSQIAFNASQVQVNQGNILFDGFSNVNLNAQNNVTFSGKGSLVTRGGNLTIRTPHVASSYYLKPAGLDPSTGIALPAVYTAANYLIDAGAGTVNMQGNGAASASTATPGGTLAIMAGEIDISTIVEVPSGQIGMTALNNLNLGSGGQLLARGTSYAPGGVVSLTSTGGGAINLLTGSLIDVSAGPQGDAGSIKLYAPIGGVVLSGNIGGQAAGGKGGSFSMVTNAVSDFSGLNNKLAVGGFNESLNIEASTGDITIAGTDHVRAHSLTITADGTNPDGTTNGGSIILDGTIDAYHQGQGGTVGLYAQKDLTIDPTGYIDARGTATATAPNAAGGDVTLAVNTGTLGLAGGTIDVSGSGAGAGGTVTFRDPPPPPGGGAQSAMSLFGTVKGASSVVAEIDKVYVNQFQTIDSTAIGRIQSDLTALMSADASLATQLANGLTDGNGNVLTPYNAALNSGTFHLQPGAVIEQTIGDITVASNWDLTSWRYGSGNEPGILTLRAAGNLYVNGNITDSPLATGANDSNNNYRFLLNSTAQPSWSYNLVAGAQTSSADLLAVVPQGVQGATGGNLVIGTASSGNVVYTQTGAIRFASGGNATLYRSPSQNNYMIAGGNSIMPYSLATYSGAIRGSVDGSLVIYPNSAIQSATGSIDIQVGKDLDLTGGSGVATTGLDLGAIRTTGERRTVTGPLANYYVDSKGNFVPRAYTVFDYYSYYAGGSIALDVAGNLVGGLNPNAWLYTGTSITTAQRVKYYPVTASYSQTTNGSQIVTQGIAAMAGGSVSVRAGGDFSSQVGTFGQGDLQVYSGGNVTGRFMVEQGKAEVSAMGNFGVPAHGSAHVVAPLIEMGASQVSVAARGNVEMGGVVSPNLAEAGSASYWDNGYTQGSSVTLTAITGDVNMYNAGGSFATNGGYLPPSAAISAGRDIVVSGNYTQLPAQYGSLSMVAGRDILFTGGVTWVMSDADLNTVYPGHPVSITNNVALDYTIHASSPVHTGDPNPVVISAGRDINDMYTAVPKMASIFAGGSINDLNFIGQNIAPTDVTSIIASQGIIYSHGTAVGSHGIQVGGPGYALVQAGGKIDLGVSVGIQSIGNSANPAILAPGQAGAALIVAAGIESVLSPQAVPAFFEALRSAGTAYSTLQAAGDSVSAQAVIERTRADIISPFLGSANDGQDITMTSSQISTAGGGSVFVLATGVLNVGTTELSSQTSKSTGILTETGGAINVFANRDVNVNESRVMTFQGGDITVWSDRGNINAGKGDKAAISASTPTYHCKDGVCSVTFSPPAVGSGIRALTYAPDENTPAPPAGDIYLFAPQGVIDAGEAGISGGKIILGATAILNASNISFTTGSVGLAGASQGVSLGALTGSSDLSGKNSISSDTGALAQAQERVASAQPIEDMVVKFIDVKVMSYDLTFGAGEGPDDLGESRDKKKTETQQ